MNKTKSIKGYKAFNKDMTCNGFQYKEGETYECEKAKCCEEGFHMVINPLDALNYYDINESVFYEVEALGKINKSNDDSKRKKSDYCKCKRVKHQNWYVLGTNEEICARCMGIVPKNKTKKGGNICQM